MAELLQFGCFVLARAIDDYLMQAIHRWNEEKCVHMSLFGCNDACKIFGMFQCDLLKTVGLQDETSLEIGADVLARLHIDEHPRNGRMRLDVGHYNGAVVSAGNGHAEL